MDSILKFKIRQLLGCLIFFCTSCGPGQSGYKDYIPTSLDSLNKISFMQRAYSQLPEAERMIRSGDVVTRTGNDFTSEALKNLNRRNKTYSHCGIASIENDTVFIYHALGGEWNPDEKLRRDPFQVFADPVSNRGIAAFRISLPDSLNNRLMRTVRGLYKKAVTFDMDFNLHTDDKMYCAEFVYKSFLLSSGGTIRFPLSHIKGFEFVGVDDIFLYPECRKLLEIKYK